MATEDYEYLDEFIAFAEELEPDLGPLFGRDAARIARALEACRAKNAKLRRALKGATLESDERAAKWEACRAERERLLADVRVVLGSAPHFVQDVDGEVYSALQRLLTLSAAPTSPAAGEAE
jgi:hypothetical protein